ncbi:hypothetical protein [Mycolicibacterium tusciae]|uniref:hypothetical protein n=1 Tax=Mycolicibacterium tusciae TaxID=75922 RepID=UPI001F44E9ED|nr:hypothetical protein [Mycolicibacterium tusciae]
MAKPAPSGLRVLGRLRLSRSTEECTSITRQREIIQQWAEDVDASGSVDRFESPELASGSVTEQANGTSSARGGWTG